MSAPTLQGATNRKTGYLDRHHGRDVVDPRFVSPVNPRHYGFC